MASLVEIYNQVLGDLAADLVADPQKLTGNAQVLAARYPSVRDMVLRAYPWNCAIRRATLGALADAPDFGFLYQYRLPTDPWCLRAIDIGDKRARWKVEGRLLLTDKPAPIRLRYIARITDTEQFDPLLVQAIVSRLGSLCAWKITKKARGDELRNLYKADLVEARSVDAQEGWPEEVEFESAILDAIEGDDEWDADR